MSSLHVAAKTWNNASETLEQVNRRIHDGVPLDQLDARADRYVSRLFELYPFAEPKDFQTSLEIGSGTGYIMKGLKRYLTARGVQHPKIIGLDIAENMLAKAHANIGADPTFDFLLYDGITVPLPDHSIDFIYSVAAMQHIPKPYVYNLFFEIRRLLKDTGFAVIHLLSWRILEHQEKEWPWRTEIYNQVHQVEAHWHHFYSIDELNAVLKVGCGFPFVTMNSDIMLCVGNAEKKITASVSPIAYDAKFA
jgi:SAM-dependent methyltransferase